MLLFLKKPLSSIDLKLFSPVAKDMLLFDSFFSDNIDYACIGVISIDSCALLSQYFDFFNLLNTDRNIH